MTNKQKLITLIVILTSATLAIAISTPFWIWLIDLYVDLTIAIGSALKKILTNLQVTIEVFKYEQ